MRPREVQLDNVQPAKSHFEKTLRKYKWMKVLIIEKGQFVVEQSVTFMYIYLV